MDPKTEAQRRREAADLLDQVAAKFQPLSADVAEAYRRNAESNRRTANLLDPPQPEWKNGDLVRDYNGNLWQYNLRAWHSGWASHSTEVLTREFSPLTRVLTYDPAKQRIADPAKQEVVVSLDGIDRERLDAWAGYTELSLPEAVARRAALAAREQLGQVQ